MEKSSDGFVRADQIDLKSLDEQLERHLNRAWTMEKNKKKLTQDDSVLLSVNHHAPAAAAATAATASPPALAGPAAPSRQRFDWEIDPAKLIIKSVIARGTFGTVHRGIYDGQDVAGQSPTCQLIITPLYISLFLSLFFVKYISTLFTILK
nr:serine/threonine-protein kinase HT1-like [Ipomoea batatas]